MTDEARAAALAWYEEYQVTVDCDPQEDFDWYIAGALSAYVADAVSQAVKERDARDAWHKGFCTPSCTPGHHASGCYEQMINDAKEEIARLRAGPFHTLAQCQEMAKDV